MVAISATGTSTPDEEDVVEIVSKNLNDKTTIIETDNGDLEGDEDEDVVVVTDMNSSNTKQKKIKKRNVLARQLKRWKTKKGSKKKNDTAKVTTAFSSIIAVVKSVTTSKGKKKVLSPSSLHSTDSTAVKSPFNTTSTRTTAATSTKSGEELDEILSNEMMAAISKAESDEEQDRLTTGSVGSSSTKATMTSSEQDEKTDDDVVEVYRVDNEDGNDGGCLPVVDILRNGNNDIDKDSAIDHISCTKITAALVQEAIEEAQLTNNVDEEVVKEADQLFNSSNEKDNDEEEQSNDDVRDEFANDSDSLLDDDSKPREIGNHDYIAGSYGCFCGDDPTGTNELIQLLPTKNLKAGEKGATARSLASDLKIVGPAEHKQETANKEKIDSIEMEIEENRCIDESKADHGTVVEVSSNPSLKEDVEIEEENKEEEKTPIVNERTSNRAESGGVDDDEREEKVICDGALLEVPPSDVTANVRNGSSEHAEEECKQNYGDDQHQNGIDDIEYQLDYVYDNENYLDLQSMKNGKEDWQQEESTDKKLEEFCDVDYPDIGNEELFEEFKEDASYFTTSSSSSFEHDTCRMDENMKESEMSRQTTTKAGTYCNSDTGSDYVRRQQDMMRNSNDALDGYYTTCNAVPRIVRKYGTSICWLLGTEMMEAEFDNVKEIPVDKHVPSFHFGGGSRPSKMQQGPFTRAPKQNMRKNKPELNVMFDNLSDCSSVASA